MSSSALILHFSDISADDLPLVGGKGANLGEMARAGFPVPPGFCLTTAAFRRFLATCATSSDFYAALAALPPDDLAATRRLAATIRQALETLPIPREIETAVSHAWQQLDPTAAYAVRSSATAEDLPGASFAGQQDTYLNVCGEAELLTAVRRCWASLFTDRAILYRRQNGFRHQDVALAVVVQQMVLAEISGILFTADPVSQQRHIASIDASYGLGEALVSGRVSADLYRADRRTQVLTEVKVGDKQVAIRPLAGGGTYTETISGTARTARVLSDAQALALAHIGGQIEAHYGRPQDIEWAIAAGQIAILQTRPITTLFPLPEPKSKDEALHLYVSLSHAQVMTDPIKPLGIAIWRALFPAGRDARGDSETITGAGGRLYLDLTPLLQWRLTRRVLPRFLTVADELIAASVGELVQRPEFLQRLKRLQTRPSARDLLHYFGPIGRTALSLVFRRDPEAVLPAFTAKIDKLIDESRTLLAQAAPGADRLQVAHQELQRGFDRILPRFAGLVASGLLSQRLLARLMRGRAHPADLVALGRGLSGNVTTEMDLAVGDLADQIRQSPALVELFLSREPLLAVATAASMPGSEPFLAGWNAFLATYGMRGPSEIDISRPRWHEDPTSLLQYLVGNLQQSEMGSHRAHHAGMAAAGELAARRLHEAARRGILGPLRFRLVRRLTRAVRHLSAGREHPKFYLIRLLALVKEVLLETAAELQAADKIDAVDDVWFLDLHELKAAVAGADWRGQAVIAQRRATFEHCSKLSPPRVITSDGEIVTARLQRSGLPAGALPGSAASGGTVEGIARVVRDPNRDVLAKGEILVAPFTDPGWTPLFINAAGLVMEVGGLMTHGSVVAREYGIPAVVGVLDATSQIQSGQRIRVHGDQGYVEMLPERGE